MEIKSNISILRGWARANCRSIRRLCVDLPRYASPANDPIRAEMKPSSPRLLLGVKRWVCVNRWELPRLGVSIMDGMGEHYGYPRHRALILLWWNRRGYAWGLEYSANN